MPRILLIIQEKGGVGKTVFARALAEAVDGAPVFEIDASRRMLELGDRVSFFKMRATREDIERSGGKASRAEFDAVIDAIAQTKTSTVVDVGANTSMTFLTMLSDIAPSLSDEGLDFGICVVVTNEPGALAEAPKLLSVAKPWTKARFMIENRLHGGVDATWLNKFSNGATATSFEHQSLEDGADEYLQAGGLLMIGKLDAGKLRARHGIGPALRIQKDLERFRKEAMEAVRPAAEWLIG
ncbi:hypothetical protein WN73_19085 [Bradyrhizobium sp. CCBAU 45394]|uniref:hypothetical protein n=1 Tax=Bradyrhizobium sp. CCBAU 45394 TaxID=1325087 RepID=UPI0023033F04|nr:hypothetical protein [Bradyrhizobium sp. CCBAU 45394]MDA9392633.1 hypothetical protein [Bradyrhizobium sp. CCBAU 45394]